MKNERMITRKLFISCILILSIIFTTIIILQKEHYEKIIEENNNNTEIQLNIIEANLTNLKTIREWKKLLEIERHLGYI